MHWRLHPARRRGEKHSRQRAGPGTAACNAEGRNLRKSARSPQAALGWLLAAMWQEWTGLPMSARASSQLRQIGARLGKQESFPINKITFSPKSCAVRRMRHGRWLGIALQGRGAGNRARIGDKAVGLGSSPLRRNTTMRVRRRSLPYSMAPRDWRNLRAKQIVDFEHPSIFASSAYVTSRTLL